MSPSPSMPLYIQLLNAQWALRTILNSFRYPDQAVNSPTVYAIKDEIKRLEEKIRGEVRV